MMDALLDLTAQMARRIRRLLVLSGDESWTRSRRRRYGEARRRWPVGWPRAGFCALRGARRAETLLGGM